MINISYFSLKAQVGIGTTDPHSSSALEVSSPNSGFLPPRLTTANRDAITNPAAGLMIYNLDENCINFLNSSEWISLCGGSQPEFRICGDPITFMYKGESVTYGTVESSTGRCWLDRNLGASQVATTKTDSNAYGDLFQWGRLDDGHQNRGMVGTTGTRSTTDIPGHNRLITNDIDWRNPQKDGLWQEAIGMNNPCPAGFRLPTIIEWQLESASWSTSNANGAFNSPLKLILAGDRYQSSTILGVGERGNYWSNTTLTGNPKLSKKMYFENSFMNSDSSDYRSFGACVRCIR